MRKITLFWMIVIVIGLAVLFSMDSNETITMDDSQFTTKIPRGAKPIAPATDFASCSLDGEIRYVTRNFYKSDADARLRYENVDNNARHINWTIKPNKDTDVILGPNLISGLEIPADETTIGIQFVNEPLEREYELTATITYGVLTKDRDVEILEVECKGSTKVIMDY